MQDHGRFAPPEAPPAPPRAIVYAFPWAFGEQGPDEQGPDVAFAELRACGIDAVQLASSYHVASFLTPRRGQRPIRHGDLGGLCFDPRGVDVAWPFLPPVSPQATSRPDVRQVLAGAERHGLPVIAWVVYLYQHALARGRPELAVHDAHGEPSAAHLCPANPEVRAYVHALTEAVLTLGRFQGLHAESLAMHPFDHGLLNPKAAVTPSRRVRLLLSLCFCRHCRAEAAAAGLAVDSFASEVRRRIEAHLDALPDGDPADAVTDVGEKPFDEDLRAWRSLHEREVTTLHEEVFSLAGAAGVRTGSSIVEGDDLGLNGRAPMAIRRRVDEVRFRLVPGLDAFELEERIAECRRHTQPNVPTYAFLDIARFPSEQAFAEAVALAHDLGVRHFRFYAYGLMSGRQMAWLRGQRGRWT